MSATLVCGSIRRTGLPESLARCWPADRAARATLLAATSGAGRERLVLATCARVELYLVEPSAGDDFVASLLADLLRAAPGAIAEWSATYRGIEAAEHLMRVAAGLESRVLGEPQILQQARRARLEASAQQAAGPLLTALGGLAVHAGKRVRRETALGAGGVSAATLAVDRLASAWGTLRGRVVAVVGSGHMARDVVRELARRRAGDIVVVSGDVQRARRVVREAGHSVPFVERIAEVLPAAGGVIACTTAKDYVLRSEDIVGRTGLHLIDLGTPRNIDPAAGQLAGVSLTHLDDLPANTASPEAIASAERIVAEELARFESWLAGRELAADIARLRASRRRDPQERRMIHEQIKRLKHAAGKAMFDGGGAAREIGVTSRGVVLAAHGSREAPAVNEAVRRMAEALCGQTNIEARAAFHAGSPAFDEILDELPPTIREVTVVPVMTSQGYYAEQVLPAKLAKNCSYARRCVRITRPVGTHPRMAEFVRRRAIEIAAECGLDLARTALAVVGHGTARHAGSNDATLAVVRDLAGRSLFADVRPAFLEEAPFVGDLRQAIAPGQAMVVIPYLIGGDHGRTDIPAALGLSRQVDATPVAQRVGGRLIVCDRPIGAQPQLVDIIRELVEEAFSAAPLAAGATP